MNTRITAVVLSVLALVTPSFANDALPVKPEPVRPVPALKVHHRPDWEFIAASSVEMAALTDDLVTTAGWIRYCAICTEAGFAGHDTRDIGKIVRGQIAFNTAILVASYEWKHHVHNRFLNKAWLFPQVYETKEHISAAQDNRNIIGLCKLYFCGN
jgi:hypothetical protein